MELFIGIGILAILWSNFRRKTLFAWRIKHNVLRCGRNDNYFDGPAYVHYCHKHRSGWVESIYK